MDQQKEEQFAAAITKKIFDGVLLRIAPELQTDQKEHLKNLLQKPDNEDELAQYLEQHVPNIKQIMQEEMSKVENEMATIMDGIDDGTSEQENKLTEEKEE